MTRGFRARERAATFLDRGPTEANRRCAEALVALLAEQAEQHQEQIEEVEIERQRAHYGTLGLETLVHARVEAFLDLLGIPGREAEEDQDADHRDGKAERARRPDDVDDRGDDQAEQA